jgi:cell division protein FtsL
MSYYEDGNLARPLDYGVPYAIPKRRVESPAEREAKKHEKREQLKREEAARKEYKAAGRVHTGLAFRLVFVILMISALSGFIVWRNARITEISFSNAGLQRQINEFEKQNSQMQDHVAGKASLQMVREQAVDLLGMQKVASEQVIRVSSAHFMVYENNPLLTADDDACMDLIEAWVIGR